MKEKLFSLRPFPGECPLPGLKIEGSIARHVSSLLTISYEVTGIDGEVLVPAKSEIPARKHGLWKETCFELFLAQEGSTRYRELNLSPAGHWNVYRFDGYREGMREEPAFAVFPFTVRRLPDTLRVTADIDLRGILRSSPPVEVGVSAVLKHTDGEISYWALTHQGPSPDFHRRDAFLIEL
jgi:hypothetical protein